MFLTKQKFTTRAIYQLVHRNKTTITKKALIRSSLEDPWASLKGSAEVRDTVRKVLGEIQEEGEVAVARYAKQYESNVRPQNDFRLTEKEIEGALS